MNFLSILAAAATQVTSQPAPGWVEFVKNPMFPLILLIAVMYIFMFRANKNKTKKREAQLSQIKRGDRVQTIGGILGTVVEVRDSEVLLKVDESSNTKIRFARSAVHRVIDEEKTEPTK